MNWLVDEVERLGDDNERLSYQVWRLETDESRVKLEKAKRAFNDLVALEKVPGTIATAFDTAMDIARKALAELEEI